MSATRRQFIIAGASIAAGSTMGLGAAEAFGEESRFNFGVLHYNSPTWNSRPNALSRLLLELELSTSLLIESEARTVRADLQEIVDCPLIVVGGDRGFDPWSTSEREALATWIRAGGLLLVDSSEGRSDGEFYRSIQREIDAIMPGESLSRVNRDHVVFKSFYLCEGSEGRVVIENYMEGVQFDGRYAILYSHNDLMGAWARDDFGNYEFQVHPGGERQRTMTMRLGVNIAMYALCLDYKEDQVHVPFILRRRRWRVE